MDKKTKTCVEFMRKLVADVQGAPYPGEDFTVELYRIWYEHAQRAVVDCFEFLDDNFPEDRSKLTKEIKQMFK